MTLSHIAVLGAEVKKASVEVAQASGAVRQEALRAAARALRAAQGEIIEANEADLVAAQAAEIGATAIDRLRLDEGRIEAMARGLETVAGLPDPVGVTVDGSIRPNGLKVTRVRRPLGVIGVIYENRPNVTADAAGLCIAAGNAAFLRGSSTSIRSNVAVTAALRAGLVAVGLPAAAITLVEDTSHETAAAFMQLEGIIDCLIPRGGPALIGSMRAHATVPYVLDGGGNCHVYVDRAADLDMAIAIIVNAKTQLAKSVAELTGARLIRLQCYEGLDESKALYEWNYRKQLLRIQAGQGSAQDRDWSELEEDIFDEDFLLTRPLLEAIRAKDPVVLLIDEVDRVELETEALMLEILSEYQVSIPELGTVTAEQIPMVFLTSNNTRELSEALKRRCLFLHVGYPDVERERMIVERRVPGISGELALQIAQIVRTIRSMELRKHPSVSETIDWARTLVVLGKGEINETDTAETLHILLKYQSDIERARHELLGTKPAPRR